jgi:hypothetical protein
VPQELVANRVIVALGTERLVALGGLRPLVDQVAGLPVERGCLGVGFDEVLADLGADQLHQEADVAQDRIHAQDGVPGLDQIPRPERGQPRQHGGRNHPPNGDGQGGEHRQRGHDPHTCDDQGPRDHRVRVARVTAGP